MKYSLPKEVEWVWDARWASYWVGDAEYHSFSNRDFYRKASVLKKAGVNAVITFGFHARWRYIEEWDKLLVILRKICDSCHDQSIKVVEHHSAVVTFNPIGKEEWENVHPNRFHIGDYHSICNGDFLYQGVRLSQMRQIDPRTGQFSRSNYQGWILCHNNPDYKHLYFAYLEKIYACGVDGIMTDDIMFNPPGYGCGCIYCREKFLRDTGRQMPPTGFDDENFYGNLDNPAYRAWILWRIECHREHQERVFMHFRGLGLELARPMYSSSNTNSYGSRGMGVALDNLEGFYSTIFTEVNSTEPQSHCWLRVAVESKQRNALAYRVGVPSMCLFYPHNKEENLFCWAMTKTCGQRYWGTNGVMGLKKETGMLNQVYNFESTHSQLYERPESVSEVGVLFSAHTVWLHQDNDTPPDHITMSDPASTDCWAGWCEMLMLTNIPFDTIVEDDLEESRYFDRLRLIIVPNAVCLSDKQIKKLKEFTWKGGNIIITHQSGLKTETGAWRKEYPFSEVVGADYEEKIDKSPLWQKAEDCELNISSCSFAGTPVALFKLHKNTATWMKLKNSTFPALFHSKFGKGSVITFAGKPGRVICVNRHKRFEKDGKWFARIDFNRNKNVMTVMEESVRHLLRPGAQMKTTGVPKGFIIGMFGHENRTVLHITNAAGVLSDTGKVVPIPAPLQFPRADTLSGGGKTMRINLRRKGKEVILRSPEFSGERRLACRRKDEYTVIDLPSDFVRCYSVMELR